MIRRLSFVAAGIFLLLAGLGCPGDIGDPTGITFDGEDCAGGPVNLTYPVTAYCEIESISVHVEGPGMESVDLTIDRGNPSAELVIPSGINRAVTVTIRFKDLDAILVKTDVICIPDGQPVVVTIVAVQGNHSPIISGGIDPSGGTVRAGEPVSLRVSAGDIDPCDRLSYRWSTTNGTIEDRGESAIWTPAGSAKAKVKVTVSDGRGGKDSAESVYDVVASSPPPPPPPVNNPPVVSDITASVAGLLCTCATYTLTAAATDPDGDPLTYVWSVVSPTATTEGTFTGSGKSVGFTTPEFGSDCYMGGGGTSTVTVTASDGEGGSDTFSKAFSSGDGYSGCTSPPP